MTISIERIIKNEYAKFFVQKDFPIFKEAADYYFETAAKILMKDIAYEKEHLKLLRRNVTKRLFIGIGCELLLKAIYLKNGFCINKPKLGKPCLYRIVDINQNNFTDDDTLTLNHLIGNIFTVEDYGKDKSVVEKGLRISKVFRNKEGHVVVYWHEYDPQNYRDVEASLICIYKESFNEELKLTFSVAVGEEAIFDIKQMDNQRLT